jgi:hypothetical protein
MTLAARALAALALAVAPACGGTPTDPDDVEAASRQLTTAHFVFHYAETDASAVAALAPAVEERSRRIVDDLRAGEMVPVHVHYHATHGEMANAVRPFAGNIAAWVTGLVTAADRIHVLSPSRGQAADAAIITVLHEFAHCVTLHVNTAAGNNPRWLWETVALYEAGERVDPRTLSYMAAGQVPTLAALSEMSNRQVYEVGFVLGEFIVDRGGLEALRALIVRHGDTASVFGLDTAAFETAWREFLRQRYGLP